jgi:hypothetical protein
VRRNKGLSKLLGALNVKQRETSLVALFLAMLVGGCAESPNAIAPAYVSSAPFMSLTCRQLGEEQARITTALTTASAQQASAHKHDIIGVLLIGLPLDSMSGGDVAAQVAQYKGEEIAIDRAARIKSCYTDAG